MKLSPLLTERTLRRFAFFPRMMSDGTRVWLERYYVSQRLVWGRFHEDSDPVWMDLEVTSGLPRRTR